MQIILLCLGTIGCVLVIIGYLIKYKKNIQLIAGISKNEKKIKDKNAFASLVGGNVLLLGIMFCVGTLGIFICPSCRGVIEQVLLISLLVLGTITYMKAKKYIA